MNINSALMSMKADYQSYKRINEFSCYVRLERNGVEMKLRLNTNTICKIQLIEYTYKLSATEKSLVYKVHLKNSADQEFFSVEVLQIVKILDKLIVDGKITILVQQGQDNVNIFLHKTTKEILENFIKQIQNIKSNLNTANKITDNNLPNTTNTTNTSNTINATNIINKKRKLQDLYAQSNSNNSLNLKKIKKTLEPIPKTAPIKIKQRLSLLDLCEDLTHNLFEYVDFASLTKLSLLNKKFKQVFDSYIESLRVRDDIPTKSINNLLNRFSNLKHLSLGEGKFLKNENFKYFDVDLKNLNSLDISEITNLNDASIRKLLSKTKSSKIYKIKINFFLDSIHSAIIYIFEFFFNLTELDIGSTYKNTHIDNLIKHLEKWPKVFNPNIFNLVCEIIEKKQHLKIVNLFVFNASNLKAEYQFFHAQTGKNLLSKLQSLSLNILLINKVKDLHFLRSASNLESLRIDNILVIEDRDNLKFFKKLVFSQMNLNLNLDNQLNGLSLDFDNDYIELFISLFSKMPNLVDLSLGEFVNDEIIKIISLFCKGLNSLKISSNLISDERFKDILNNCKDLSYLDLRGCGGFEGNCFTELDVFPFALKSVKLSLVNFNFYNLIQFLKNKGVKAENYLIKSK